MTRSIGYPPFDTLKPIADNVWIVDAPPVHAGGIPLPIRMTVLRLAGGELLLHSPIPHHPALRRAVEELGRIGHLVAPSVGHWMFLRDWQAACPNAITWAVPGLKDRGQVRRSGVRIDAELGDRPPRVWADEIEPVLVAGPVFKEVCLFHHPSRTLLLTDLVINLEAAHLPPKARVLAALLGILAPRGRAPLYLRMLLRLNRRDAAPAARRLVGFRPDRVVFAHGRWFDRDAPERLERSLDWLLAPAPTGRAAAAAILGVLSLATLVRRRRR